MGKGGGGHGEGGSHATPVGKAMYTDMAAEAISEQNEGTPTPYTEGGGGKDPRFKAKRGGGLEIVSEPKGIGKRSKCQETDGKANCQDTGSEAASAECAGEHSDGQGPADKGGNSRANHSESARCDRCEEGDPIASLSDGNCKGRGSKLTQRVGGHGSMGPKLGGPTST